MRIGVLDQFRRENPATPHYVPRGKVIPCACVLIICMFAGHGAAQCTPPSPKGPQPFNQLRYEENYSYLRDEKLRTEPLDRIKYIPLNNDESTYVSFGGEIRERYEVFRNPDWGADPPDNNGYLLQRYMVHSDLHFGSRVRFFFQLKSALVTDEVTVRPPDLDTLDVNQGFIDISLLDHARRSVLLRSGRQEIQFGSSRLVSFREGPNVRQSFDGFRLSVCEAEWKIDLFAVKPVETNPGVFDDAPDHSRSFWGIYAVHPVGFLARAFADIYYLGLDRKNAKFAQGTAREIRHSLGARLWRLDGGLDYNFEALFQWGTFGAGHIRAWTAASDTGYTVERAVWKPRLGLKADAASGDKNPNDPNLQAFNPLFPKGSYFGEESLLGPVNFMDLHPTLDLHVTKTVTLTPQALFFWRQSTNDGLYGPAVNLIFSGNASRERYVGANPELQLDWQINRHLGATTYYSHFFAGPFLQASGPGKDTDFFALWVAYKF
jgi:hypothetical protein